MASSISILIASLASSTARTATSQALVTLELFEQVLYNMGMATLLLAQRVSRHWKNTTETSHELQVKLFFKAAADDEEAVGLCLEMNSIVVKGDGYAITNSLLLCKVGGVPEWLCDTVFTVLPNVLNTMEKADVNKLSRTRVLASQPPPTTFSIEVVEIGDYEDCSPVGSSLEMRLSDNHAPNDTTPNTRIQYADKVGAAEGVAFSWYTAEVSIMFLSKPM